MVIVSPTMGRPLEQDIGGLEAEDGDAALLGQIGVVNKAASGHGNETDRGVVRRHSHDVAGGVGPLADLVEIGAAELDGRRAHFGEVCHGHRISHGELVGTHSGVLVGDSRNGPVPHHDQVVAEFGEIAALPGAKAFAEPDQDKQRTDAPRNSKHGEEAAQLVGCDSPENLTECVGKGLHDGSTSLDRNSYRSRTSFRYWIGRLNRKYADPPASVPFRHTIASRSRAWKMP